VTPSTQIVRGHTNTCECLANRLAAFSERWVLGVPSPRPATAAGGEGGAEGEGSRWEIEWTRYGELDVRARAFASGLRQLGVARGDHVILMARNCVDWVVADFACIFAGFVSVPIEASCDEVTIRPAATTNDRHNQPTLRVSVGSSINMCVYRVGLRSYWGR
jgi:hypothetical protein